MKVLVWNEYVQQDSGLEKEAYPETIHGTICDFLNKQEDITASSAVLSDPEHGLTQEVLDQTDVLLWWGHRAHGDVSDQVVDRVVNAVQRGMGVVFLHSSHLAKPFTRLMGTSCSLSWLEHHEISEKLHVVNPIHPIAAGVPLTIDIPHDEVYAEPFDIPYPEDVVFIGSFSNGSVFRSGVCYKRGLGKVFYFQPGHETYPVYKQPEIQQIITNAVNWVKPVTRIERIECPHLEYGK